MKSRTVLVFIIGFFVWLIFNTYFYPIIPDLIIDKGYPMVINDIYFFFSYTLIGFFLGWFGRTKGWLSGLILGVLICICFIVLQITSPIDIEGIQQISKIRSLFLIFVSHIVFTIYLIIGSCLGEFLRSKNPTPEGPALD